jgi:hypothetical protein
VVIFVSNAILWREKKRKREKEKRKSREKERKREKEKIERVRESIRGRKRIQYRIEGEKEVREEQIECRKVGKPESKTSLNF